MVATTDRTLRVSASLRIALAGIIGVGLALVAPISTEAAMSATQRNRAKVVATEAIYHYRDKKFMRAAALFTRVWQISNRSMHRMLRNAAKSYEAAGKRKRALRMWERLERPLTGTDLSHKEAALLRKEARIHTRDLRLIMGQQRFERAEQFYTKRRYRQAGDAYIEAYRISHRQTPAYLRFAARAYEKGRLVDEALIGWRSYGEQPGVGTIGREEARKRQAVLRAEMASLQRNKEARALYRRGRFRKAAAAFLASHERAPKRRLPQLRMAALAFQRGRSFPEARYLWRRYATAKSVTALGRQNAEDHVRAIDLRLLTEQAVALAKSRKHKLSGDRWLEAYAVSVDKSPIYLRKAAIAFEKAKSYELARTMWLRYSTTPTVADDDQEVAYKRSELLRKTGSGGRASLPPPPNMGIGSLAGGSIAQQRCTGCLVTLGLGAASALGGMALWSLAENRSMRLHTNLQAPNGVVTGIDRQTAKDDEAAINRDRYAGAVLMGIGGVALLAGVISEIATSGSSVVDDTAVAWQFSPTSGGVAVSWGRRW